MTWLVEVQIVSIVAMIGVLLWIRFSVISFNENVQTLLVREREMSHEIDLLTGSLEGLKRRIDALEDSRR